MKNDNEMRGDDLNSVHSVKDLGVTVTSNFKFFQQCNESVIRANRIMGLIKINYSLKNKDVVLSLNNSFVRPHLEYAVQFWCPHHAKDKV